MEKMKNVERQKSFKMTRFGEAAQAGKSKFASKNKIFDGMYHLQEHKEEGMEKEEKQEKRINEIDQILESNVDLFKNQSEVMQSGIDVSGVKLINKNDEIQEEESKKEISVDDAILALKEKN